ncbi:MAG: hypothetical protein ACK5KO_03780 [Arachnia sp.]
MKTTKIRASFIAAAIAVTGAVGLVGCSGDEESTATEAQASEAAADIDVATDLQTARQAVEDALADDDWAQVMLASDVTEPTVKYGLMVMPFVASENAARVTGTVDIGDDGSYVIEAESAASGQTWQIDQDGNITEVTQ